VSRRLEKSWVVLDSFENIDGSRCVDVFCRPDGTFGFEEFRRDPEDAGLWTPVAYFSGKDFKSKEQAIAAAKRAVTWLASPNGS
jgi:hypothetical protein